MSYNKETGMYEGYIYKIVNDVNDKVYIGQTRVTIRSRFNQHKSDAKRGNAENNLLHNAMIKYGINHFYVEEIIKYEFENKQKLIDVLNDKECFYISFFNSIRPKGYNISKGGGGNSNPQAYIGVDVYDLDCNYITSYENASIASSMTGIGEDAIRKCYTHDNQRAGNYIFTKIGELPTIPKSILKRVEQYTLDYSVCLNVYDNAKIASEKTGIQHGNIINCCNGKKYASAGGFRWKYEGEDKINNNVSIQQTPVDMYTKKLEYIKSFNSINDAYKETGISQSSISMTISNRNKTAGGYIWRKAGDDISTYKYGIQKESQKINVYDNQRNFIKQYTSIKSLINELKIPRGSIYQFIKSERLYKDTYYFKYVS